MGEPLHYDLVQILEAARYMREDTISELFDAFPDTPANHKVKLAIYAGMEAQQAAADRLVETGAQFGSIREFMDAVRAVMLAEKVPPVDSDDQASGHRPT